MGPLWEPSEDRIRNANVTKFIDFVNKKYSLNIRGYHPLYDWSVENREDFWASVWEFCNIIASKPYDKILEDSPTMIGAKWFIGSRLNFAQNLLRFRDDRIALVFRGEGQKTVRMTYAQLYDEVARLAKSLREAGVVVGDRVAGYCPNMMQPIVAMLATASIGAIWSSCSPDFGIKGVLDRFGQIEPKILFTADGYFYNGKTHSSLDRIAGIIREIPSIEKLVVIPYTQERADIGSIPKSVHYKEFLSKEPGLEIEFEQLPFDHPLYIMYSSGTTGLPKCMVHGAGGTLIQHLKEHVAALRRQARRQDILLHHLGLDDVELARERSCQRSHSDTLRRLTLLS